MLRDKIKQLLARLRCTTEWAGEAKRANRWLALDMAFGFIACVPSSSSTGVHPCWLRENFPYKSKPKAVDLPSIRWAPQLDRSSALRVPWDAGWLTRTLHLFEQLHCVRNRGSIAAMCTPDNNISTSAGVRQMKRLARQTIVVVLQPALGVRACRSVVCVHSRKGYWSRRPEQAPFMCTPLAFQQWCSSIWIPADRRRAHTFQASVSHCMPAVVSPAIVVLSTSPWTVSIPGTRLRYVRTGSIATQKRRTEKDLPMSTPVTIILVCIMIHKGALQAVRICKIQYGLMRSKALDRSRERTAQGEAWSSVVWTDCTALCGSRNKFNTVWDGWSKGAMALVMTVAMLPSITLSKVDGIPKGRKLSAAGPILALGIHACTEHGGGAADLQMSSKCVVIASAEVPGCSLHAA